MIGVSFLPVLALEAQEERLFKPLAYTKTLAMLVAAVLAITLDPALRMLLTGPQPFDFRPVWLRRAANTFFVGKVRQEEIHPVSRFLMRVYAPVAAWTLRHAGLVIGAALLLVAATVPAFMRLGSEFMPPLEEGSLFYMPTTMPGISITEAGRLLQVTDRIIARPRRGRFRELREDQARVRVVVLDAAAGFHAPSNVRRPEGQPPGRVGDDRVSYASYRADGSAHMCMTAVSQPQASVCPPSSRRSQTRSSSAWVAQSATREIAGEKPESGSVDREHRRAAEDEGDRDDGILGEVHRLGVLLSEAQHARDMGILEDRGVETDRFLRLAAEPPRGDTTSAL